MGTGEVAPEQVILATGGYDHTIRFWAAYNGQCQRIVQHPDSQVNALDITPDRQLLAAGGFQHVRMYDIQGATNPNPVINYEGIVKNITSVGFHEEMRWMYSGGEDGSVRIWDLRSRNLQCQRIFSTTSAVNCVSLHPNQSELYIGDQSGLIHVWDLRNDKKEQLLVDVDISVQHLSIEPEGNYLAAVDNKGNCYMFALNPNCRPQTGSPLQRRLKFKAHKRYALKCRFSPDSTLLATTSADQTAKIWRTTDLQPLAEQTQSVSNCLWPAGRECTPHFELQDDNQRWVWDVSFSGDSQYVVTASSDNLARLWSLNTGVLKREYSGHQKAVTALAFSDGAAA